MQKNLLQSALKTTLALSLCVAPLAMAKTENTSKKSTKNNEQTLNIDFTQTTPQELAAVAIIDESCQSLIQIDDLYHKGLQRLMKELLPNNANPIADLRILTQSKAFEPMMLEARQDAQNAGDVKNREICLDIQRYAQQQN